MNRAILLTGFNNWGKTSHIYSIFRRRRFDSGRLYSIPGVNAKFTVESHSNDDYNEDRFVDAIKKKMQLAPGDSKDLFCAFCPSREPNNDSQRILQNNPFTKFDEIHVLLLKHKWDFHAELRATEIKRHLSSIQNIRYELIDADVNHRSDQQRQNAREAQMHSYLSKLYSL